MGLLEFDEMEHARIVVLGCGRGGGNAVNTMLAANLEGVELCFVSCDLQALEASMVGTKIHMDVHLTTSLGASAPPNIGCGSEEDSFQLIEDAVSGADMVFVTAGLGGSSGTSTAPVVARIARETGALTIGVVTQPFGFEGTRRQERAVAGITELTEVVDTLVVIPGDQLLELGDHDWSMTDAFKKADEILLNTVRGVSDVMTIPGLVGIDFADVCGVFRNQGSARIGIGCSKGKKRPQEAAMQAISCPLLQDVSIHRAPGLLCNITGGADLTIHEISQAWDMVKEVAHEDANIAFGAIVDPAMGEKFRVTVIATGFD